MPSVDADRNMEALAWVRRIHDPSFVDWNEHLLWLEQDPANAAAFDRMLLQVEKLTADLQPLKPLPPASRGRNDAIRSPVPPARRRWLVPIAAGTAIAACAGVVVELWTGTKANDGYEIRTAPGQTRAVVLADGSRIELNGGTVLQLDRAHPRSIEMPSGEALFSITHMPDRPFTIRSGDATVVDEGTVFDVVRSGDRMDVAVREGSVTFARGESNVRLHAGDVLRADGSGSAIVKHGIEVGIGGWSEGRLTYNDVPMGEVVEDLSRSTGKNFAIDAGLADRPFSGVVALDGGDASIARRLRTVTGLAVKPEGTGWRVSTPGP